MSTFMQYVKVTDFLKVMVSLAFLASLPVSFVLGMRELAHRDARTVETQYRIHLREQARIGRLLRGSVESGIPQGLSPEVEAE